MRKKPVYIVDLTKDGMPYKMVLDYYYNVADRDRTGHEGWIFTYKGLILGSSWGKSVEVRDDLYRSIREYLRHCFLSFNVLENYANICDTPPRRKEFDHYSSRDEIWYELKSQGWLGAKHMPSIASMICPANAVSVKVCPTNGYIALKRFMKRSENRKKQTIHRTAKKFGI